MRSFLKQSLGLAVTSVLALTNVTAYAVEVELAANGDFENITDWGLSPAGPSPVGWTSSANNNPAEQLGGINAIGGSGTSALIPTANVTTVFMRNRFATPATSTWEFNMDFAAEDPGGAASRTLDIAFDFNLVVDNPRSRLFVRMVDLGDDGFGDLQFHSNWNTGDVGWTTVPALQGSVIFDDFVEETPLVHHLKIVSHFDQPQPSYDVIVTNSDGMDFTALGLRLFNTNPPERVAPSLPTGGPHNVDIFASVNAFFLIDNVSLTTQADPGDFDVDGDVDGNDFLKWQRGESPDPLGAADFAAWKDNFGAPTVALENLAAVPEPTVLTLVCVGFVGLWNRSRRKS